MKVINPSRPFNVGDQIVMVDESGSTIIGTITSWRPGVQVNVVNRRGQSSTLPWGLAERRVARDA